MRDNVRILQARYDELGGLLSDAAHHQGSESVS